MDVLEIRSAMEQGNIVRIEYDGKILDGYILYAFTDGWFIFGLIGKVKDLMVNCGMVLSIAECLKSA